MYSVGSFDFGWITARAVVAAVFGTIYSGCGVWRHLCSKASLLRLELLLIAVALEHRPVAVRMTYS